MGESRVQDNLHAHAQNEPITHHQTLLGPNQAARVSVSRNAFLSSRSKKKIALTLYCGKTDIKRKNRNMVIVVCTLIDNEYTSYLFSQTIFTCCFCILSEFANVFEGKSDAYQ